MRNLLIKLSKLAVSLLRLLPTKSERSNPEPIQVQEKGFESTVVQLFKDKDEGLVKNLDEPNEVGGTKTEPFFQPDNWVDQETTEPITGVHDFEGIYNYIDDKVETLPETQQSQVEVEKKKLDLSIEELGCSVRVVNALYRSGIDKISSLHGMTVDDLLRIKNFGEASLNELSDALYALGYSNEGGRWILCLEDECTTSDSRSSTTLPLEGKSVPDISYVSTIIDADAECFEYVAEQTSQIISEFVLSSGPFDVQYFVRRLLELAEGLNDSNVLRVILIELDVASNCYLYPASYKEEEIFKLNISRLLLLSAILNRRSLRDDAADLIRNVRKQCEHAQDSPLHLFYRIAAGETLQQIGGSLALPLSRERVRQKADQISRIFSMKTRVFIEEVNGYLETALNNDLRSYYSSEKSTSPTSLRFDFLRAELQSMTLRERLEIVEKRLGCIPSQEYDFQYEKIRSGLVSIGSGYWNEIERLSQYLHRHASADGNPKIMPKQVSLPDSVRGAVTRFGGQSYVAREIGLNYQGQLVSDGPGGRTYWDQERVDQLFTRIQEFFNLSSVDELTKDSIRYYFEWSNNEEIKGKKINSFFAALNRLDIQLSEEKGDELATLNINSISSSIQEPELIPQSDDEQLCEPPSDSQGFAFDIEVAAKMRMQDQELKHELDQIFSEAKEDDLLCESQAEAVPDSFWFPGLDVQAIVNLIRDNMTDDLILISFLKDYAVRENLMYASFVDKLNDLSIAQCGENLLEEEDSANLYVNPVALDSLM